MYMHILPLKKTIQNFINRIPFDTINNDFTFAITSNIYDTNIKQLLCSIKEEKQNIYNQNTIELLMESDDETSDEEECDTELVHLIQRNMKDNNQSENVYNSRQQQQQTTSARQRSTAYNFARYRSHWSASLWTCCDNYGLNFFYILMTTKAREWLM